MPDPKGTGTKFRTPRDVETWLEGNDIKTVE